jgi:hypothetical protein
MRFLKIGKKIAGKRKPVESFDTGMAELFIQEIAELQEIGRTELIEDVLSHKTLINIGK